MILTITIIIAILIPAFIVLLNSTYPNETNNDKEDNWQSWPIRSSTIKHKSGYLNETSSEYFNFTIEERYLTEVIIELNWLDEAPNSGPGRYENQPDSFNFTVYTPWGEIFSSDDIYNNINQAGLISEVIEIPEYIIRDNRATGTWHILVYCNYCGDQVSQINIIGVRDIADTGNAWTLNYQYYYHQK
jgi:hypothetical protein